jgi:3-oxoacyl-[acyl-carrier protein] reductase
VNPAASGPALPLAGRIALVTGAASGIGRAIALAMAGAGARVAINHLGDDTAARKVASDAAALGGEAVVVEADVRRAGQIAAMVAATERGLGPIDILVNNAGVILEKPFLELTEADWDFVVDTDLKSLFLVCRAVLPGMAARGRGAVINVASELGHLGRERYAPYCAAKAGVMGLTRALAREFAPAIRVNAIAPGPVDTPMLSLQHMSPEVLQRERAIPARRVGRPEEIAAAALFLASDQASFFYGQVLGPNGGAHMA